MRRTALAAIAAAVLLAGCSGGGGTNEVHLTPDKAIAVAKGKLDETTGVHLGLSSKGLADGQTGLVSGDGVLTRAPAFEGKIVVQLAGLQPEVPVIAVGGKVYAQLPLTTGWQEIEPTDYGAPDPAGLMAPEHGLSSMLSATTGLKKTGTERGGEGNKEVLTSYEGTVPASAAKVILPSVTGDVDATYTLTEDNELRQAVLTGDFYGTGADETYTVTVDSYGTQKDIKAP